MDESVGVFFIDQGKFYFNLAEKHLMDGNEDWGVGEHISVLHGGQT